VLVRRQVRLAAVTAVRVDEVAVAVASIRPAFQMPTFAAEASMICILWERSAVGIRRADVAACSTVAVVRIDLETAGGPAGTDRARQLSGRTAAGGATRGIRSHDAGLGWIRTDVATRAAVVRIVRRSLAAVVDDAVAIQRGHGPARHGAATLDALEDLPSRQVRHGSGTARAAGATIFAVRSQVHVARKARIRACRPTLRTFVRGTVRREGCGGIERRRARVGRRELLGGRAGIASVAKRVGARTRRSKTRQRQCESRSESAEFQL